jgi:DNA-binding winged helix-turn-helix (wHTH) protein
MRRLWDEVRPTAGPYRKEPSGDGATDPRRLAAGTVIEFGRFSVLARQRQLVTDGVPIKLGSRAFDLLLALVEADGALVTKDELFSRGWPGIVVSEENLKVQINALRNALGEDRDLVRTEFGRGYRFTATVRATVARSAGDHPVRCRRDAGGTRVARLSFWQLPQGRCARNHAGGPFDPVRAQYATPARTG